MQKLPYKIPALILCGLLIYNSLGYFMVLSVLRLAVQHQKWAELQNIPESRITAFVFEKNTSSTRLKIINEHEIQVDGQLYDVVRKLDKGDRITYHCVHDTKEENLVVKTRLFNEMAHSVPVKNTTRLIIEKIIKNCIVDRQTDTLTHSTIPYLTVPEPICYSGPVMTIHLPPPQACC
ncbi:MAG: hypothetical protein WCR72_17060 [Bacteroidota bacterium]